MAAYYNENDKFAAAWLRELIKVGLIADGEVDDRSIELVRPNDLRGFTQCHFFAGIGGWSYALRLAGWPDDRPVWTGSCPCQPFSSAGAQTGGHDPRDLWPVWFQLIAQCRPVVVFGEQVEAAIGHGWLDRLCDDMEAEDYAVGACGLPGPCVGAFDIRQRLWFVADAHERHAVNGDLQRGWEHGLRTKDRRADGRAGIVERTESLLADADGERRTGERLLLWAEATGWDASEVPQATKSSAVSDMGNSSHARLEEQRGVRSPSCRQARTDTRETALGTSPSTFWAAADWLPCTDGKARPVEPKYVAMADGLSSSLVPRRDAGDAVKEAGWPTPNSQENDMSPTEWERLNAKQKAANPNLGAKQKMLSTVAQYAETQIYGDGRDEVRTMQQDELQAARSSQGREPSEQRSIELADFVRLLPSSHALAQLHGHRATAEALSVVLSTDGAQRLLQHPPDEIETVWRSLSKETQDGFRLAVEQGGFIRTVEHPLAHGVPARVGRLRGYGNAIKPQVAQVFIEAYMSVESQHD